MILKYKNKKIIGTRQGKNYFYSIYLNDCFIGKKKEWKEAYKLFENLPTLDTRITEKGA